MYKNEKIDFDALLEKGAVEVFLKSLKSEIIFLRKHSRHDEIIKLLKNYKNFVDSNFSLLFELTNSLISNGDYKEAYDEYIKLIKIFQLDKKSQTEIIVLLRELEHVLNEISLKNRDAFRISNLNLIILTRNRIKNGWQISAEDSQLLRGYLAEGLLLSEATIEFIILIEVAESIGFKIDAIVDHWRCNVKKITDDNLVKSSELITKFLNSTENKIILPVSTEINGINELKNENRPSSALEINDLEFRVSDFENIDKSERMILGKAQLEVLENGGVDSVLALVQLGKYKEAILLVNRLYEKSLMNEERKIELDTLIEKTRSSEKN